MNEERTEYQTAGGRSTSQRLSTQATAPPADVPGYQVIRFLGAGAYGQVWVGRDLNTGRSVAIKFYLHRGGVNWSLLSREVKNLVQLSADRYVVQVLEVGWDADPPYYVMELVNGGSLEDLLQSRGRLPVDDAVQMFRDICIGLNHCHAKGVLHCDIKPANILLGDEQEPRLADFGQSRLSDDQTPALGTLFYMAPEQAHLNSTPDVSWDVYAVGAIVYRMLTGSPPYRDREIVKQIDTAGSLPKRLHRYRTAISNAPPPEEHQRRRGTDRALARIVSRCLAVEPEDRYANVQQILDDLDRRDEVRLRRPITLLGIVGPLLVLIATTVFGSMTINEAVDKTKRLLRREAFGANEFAAGLAARTLESEIQRYFDLAQSESSRPEFVEQLRETIDSAGVRLALDEIANLGTPDATQNDQRNVARGPFLMDPARATLEQQLTARHRRYSDNNPSSERPRIATMFVTDSRGTIICSSYNPPQDPAKGSVGRNVCYRNYFYGGDADYSVTTSQIGEVKPLRHTHFSAAFQSNTTRLWKVAISTPIFLDDDDEPDAVFVMTINLGDFKLLQSKQGQVAVLVEAREGPEQGTILQHPLMDARRRADTNNSLGEKRYQLQPKTITKLIGSGDDNYRDPLAKAVDGAAYRGRWIAAIQKVKVPANDSAGTDERESAAGPDDTDLLVLVQYRLDTVEEPVRQMRVDLLWEGSAAILSILIVTFTLYYFVRLSGSERSDRGDLKAANYEMTETISAVTPPEDRPED